MCGVSKRCARSRSAITSSKQLGKHSGRGMRIADGKTDCLWLDFSDTTERLGPVDAIKGRRRSRASTGEPGAAPTRVCDECGERIAKEGDQHG